MFRMCLSAKMNNTQLRYIETLKDIEATLGVVPGFMTALPVGVLVQEWPLFKKHQLKEHAAPSRSGRLISRLL